MSQYIGKTIALVSNSDIRYVGILENIDGNNGTISLSSVRSFGTEGRVTQVERMKPPSDARYGQVIFKGPDVKDLSILEVPLDQVFPEPMPIPPQAMPPFQNMGFPQMPPAQPSPSGGVPSKVAQSEAPQTKAPQTKATQSAVPTEPAAKQSSPVSRSTQPPAQPASRPSPPNAQEKAATETANDSQEYDFERNNARFVKEDSAQQQGEFYNKKSSFFDSISSSTEEENRGGGMRWAEEKNLNYDTFGQASLHLRGRGRGGFRGRGRGQFRGRGRGRGRGKPAGFQNAFENDAPAF